MESAISRGEAQSGKSKLLLRHMINKEMAFIICLARFSPSQLVSSKVVAEKLNVTTTTDVKYSCIIYFNFVALCRKYVFNSYLFKVVL